jgi:hypothetical protein
VLAQVSSGYRRTIPCVASARRRDEERIRG